MFNRKIIDHLQVWKDKKERKPLILQAVIRVYSGQLEVEKLQIKKEACSFISLPPDFRKITPNLASKCKITRKIGFLCFQEGY